jgi:hypothetical protein
MDSTHDYINAMAEAVRQHDDEIAIAEKARECRLNGLALLHRLAGMRNRTAAMTAYNASALMNACASPEWWAAQARWQVGARSAA